MKNLIRFQGAVAQLARAPALQAGCRGFEPLRLHQATNVSLRCIAVLRCRTLIERSSVTGRTVRYEPVLADIIQSRRHEYGEAARNAGGGKRAAPMCRGAPLSHLDRKIKRNGPGSQV